MPVVGTWYFIKDVAGVDAVAECIGKAKYQGDRSSVIWEFMVRLPHEYDEGRGAILRVPEYNIKELEVPDA